MTRCYIGYDSGTQGTKVAIYANDSTLVSEAYREHDIRYPRPGWAEMDPEQFYRALAEGVQECLQKSKVDPKDIHGISCSGIICGLVPVDDNFHAVGPYIPYLDGRSTEEVKHASQDLEPIWVEESGNVDIATFVPALILQWLLKNQPDVMRRAKKVVAIAHYVMGKLGGLKAKDAFIDWAHLSGWIIGYNARTRDWSDRQLSLLGIPRELLPRVTRPWDVVGTLTREQAAALGLREGIPLVAGAGDVMQSNLGSGIVDVGMCSDVAGTTSIFTVDVDRINPAITRIPGILYSIGTLEDQYLYWGYVRAGGLSLRWYRDEIAGRKGDDSFYREMDEMAAGIPPGSEEFLFYPYLQGGDPSMPNARGAWLGLHCSDVRGGAWRSILEAIAFEYLSWVKSFRGNGVRIEEVVGTGGGSRSKLWNQIKADVLSVAYLTLKRSEGAVLGNALLAAYGVGDVKDLKAAARQWVEVKDRFQPREESTRSYGTIYDKRQRILNGPLRQIFSMMAE